ncbi:MAG TPA: nucleoside hydrolase [Baekduia sp.]
MSPTRIILDTDPGLGAPGADIDDGLAIALALRSPEIVLEALTIVVGNVDVEIGRANAEALLDRLDATHVPIAVGAGRPLVEDLAPLRALFDAHLPDAGDRPADPPGSGDAARLLVDRVLASPGEITVVAIGPMTNLALAIALEPAFAENVRELVLMAGAATTYAQNITTVADFNAYADPEALQVVLDSGAPIRMVGLDQTMRVLLTRADAERMRAGGDAFGAWAADCTDAWIDFLHAAFPERPEHADACFLHDPLTIAAVIDPTLLTWAPAQVAVELQGRLTRGLAVADRGLALLPPAGPPNAQVAIDTDVDRFRSLFLDRMAVSR